MASQKSSASPASASSALRAAVIADVVSWRRTPDRAAARRRIASVLDAGNERFDPVTPLRITVGDEYQGSFASVGEALRATTWLSLALASGEDEDALDVRHGVGWGAAEVLERDPLFEDGPAWWVARDAIDHVEARSRRPGQAARRTSYQRAEGVPGPEPALVEALLICRDQVMGSLSSRSQRLLLGLLDDRTQAELADSEEISPSAVSQRVRHDGLAAMLEVDHLLGRVT